MRRIKYWWWRITGQYDVKIFFQDKRSFQLGDIVFTGGNQHLYIGKNKFKIIWDEKSLN